MKFKRIWNIIVQGSAVVGQSIVPALPVDPEIKNLAHAIIAAVQAIAGVVAHNSNPDGTAATTAYEKPPQTFDQGDR